MGRACLLRECAGRNSVPLWDLTDAGTNNEGTWKLQWDYDRFGNRVNQELIGGVGFSAFQPQLNISATTNRITDTGYTYDPAGNMTADAQYTYTYDAENRMTSVDGSAATYVYDANGLRVRKTSGTTDTYYVFSGSKVIAEYDVAGGQTTHIREYVYSGSQLVATLASDGQGGSTGITYHHLDHLSVRATSDASGALVGEQSHLPFGDPWYQSGATITKWRFTTYEHDPESDNDYAVSRYHMYRVGRFASPDTLGGDVANPQSMNRYSYVANDPINSVDPLGLMDTPVCSIGDNEGQCGGGWGFADFLSFMAGGDEVVLDNSLVSADVGGLVLRAGFGQWGPSTFGFFGGHPFQASLENLGDGWVYHYSYPGLTAVQIEQAALPVWQRTGTAVGAQSSPTDEKSIYCDDAVVAQIGKAWMATGNGRNNGGKQEAGFKVDVVNGKVSVGPIIVSPDELHLRIPDITPDTTATFHAHPLGGLEVPSTTGPHPDTANKLPTYVFSNRGLYVTDPTTKQGYRGPLRKGYPWDKCK